MSDLILTENGNNLELANFDLQVLDGSRYVANKIRIALKTFNKEWFLNINTGLPYYEDILIKNPNLDFISDLYQSEILAIPEVATLDEFILTLSATRQLEIYFIAILTDGTTVEITEVI